MDRASSDASTVDDNRSNKRRRLSRNSHNQSEDETDASFEVVGERDAYEDASSDEIDLMKLLDEADDEGQEKEDRKGIITETIDLEDDAAEQQVQNVSQEENETRPPVNKAAREYHCPICFEPPDTAVMTPCGHVFCVTCLFQMVNSSRTQRRGGHCALCRSEVKLKDIRLMILRKKRVKRD